ncbi:MAG: c-type cytochrome [Planctomycetia bacterium]|nr:c-type cytochrome [Planctomycetia bacterium]
MRSTAVRLTLFVLCVSTLNQTFAADELATKAHAILKERCFSCHGESGANEGGFNFVLNRKRLVRELVVPGDADASKLLDRIVKGEMPPDGDRVPKADIETLTKWIQAGAPALATEAKRDFITLETMLGTMLKDLEMANDRDRPFYRYFTLTHLHNAGFEDNELESHRQGLSKLINSLSRGREIKVPVPIDAAKTVLRIDLRHYKWNESDAWSHIIAADPYRVTYSFAAATQCYKHTKCELPHVRADWFVFAASRPPLYHVILDLPDTPEKFLRFERETLGVDVAANLRDYNDVIRAGFYPSGVSKSNRLIERHASRYGAYWKSYDFKPADAKQPKRQNLKAFPTGPDGNNAFEHDGGEMIFSLPNGLQGYLLTDNKGKRIDKGPTDVVVDKEAVKRGRDPEVVNGVSCMNCHWSGMLNKVDQVRDHVLGQETAYTASVFEFVKAVYVEKPTFAAKLKEDRERFEVAVKKCGLSSLAKSEPVATLAFQFDEPLDVD